MDKETAYNVVAYCIEVLLENKQQGKLQVITGAGIIGFCDENGTLGWAQLAEVSEADSFKLLPSRELSEWGSGTFDFFQRCVLVLAGRGAHSSNKQSNLKPTVLNVLREYNLGFSEAGRNAGAMIVDVQ
jgi:hypothetical protein